MSTLTNQVEYLRRMMWIVLGISAVGVAFSGTLSYKELIGTAAVSCSAFGAAGTILGLPACVYGLAMYAILATVSGLALLRHRRIDDSLGDSHPGRSRDVPGPSGAPG
jgi:hypothetical protein